MFDRYIPLQVWAIAPIGCALHEGCSQTTRLRRMALLFPHLMVAMATKSSSIRHLRNYGRGTHVTKTCDTELMLMRNVMLTVVLMRSSRSRRYRLTNDFDDVHLQLIIEIIFQKRALL
eukprot:sb/3476391/